MELKSIGYGIIGCGMMGQEHIRNIALLGDAHVAAILEPDANMRAMSIELVPDAIVVETIDQLLAVRGVDCVLIASPNFTHMDHLEAIAKIRPLPVLVEKPLFTDAGEALRLNTLRTKLPQVWVAMEYRYMPPIAQFLVDAQHATGGIQMLSIREHRYPFLNKIGDWNRFNRNTGGTFIEKGCHFLDLMRVILKSDPISVMASAGQAHNHRDESYDGAAPDIWDHGYILVDFANGTRAMLELCMFAEGSRYQEEISGVGPHGKIECLIPGPVRFWPRQLGPAPVAQIITSPRDPMGPRTTPVPVAPELLAAGDHNGATFYQHRRFVDAIHGKSPIEVTLNDGWWAVIIALAAQRSASEGRAIHLAQEFDLPSE